MDAKEEGDAKEAKAPAPVSRKSKKKDKPNKKRKEKKDADGGDGEKKKRKKPRKNRKKDIAEGGLSAAQIAVNEQMRRALEEDKYSANGSIVDTDSDEDDQYIRNGKVVRLDRVAIQKTIRKLSLQKVHGQGQGPARGLGGGPAVGGDDDDVDEEKDKEEASGGSGSRRSSRERKKKKKRDLDDDRNFKAQDDEKVTRKTAKDKPASSDFGGSCTIIGLDPTEEDADRDGGSIFGQTTGQSNSTWVECDKCKKWRRLRGVVDEKKLPSKWYCSMNKNDPERARCSAPEEEYETPHTPESAADARARKHLRVWVRRLQCNEAYESRQPTLTRGKKRAAATSSKDPYEWVRCCNPSCGKWRLTLRIMDAKTHVIDRTTDGEWYCVMNTWDEKTASCAAPQENLPAVGCPPWVMQDDS